MLHLNLGVVKSLLIISVMLLFESLQVKFASFPPIAKFAVPLHTSCHCPDVLLNHEILTTGPVVISPE